MTSPLAYHLIWTTYGSWLPGDDRGWVDSTGTVRPPDPVARNLALSAMAGEPVALTGEQRAVVDATVRRHCDIRCWLLHALHVGETHVHVVVTADRPADVTMSELKAWCTRQLNTGFGRRPDWWTEGGNRLRVDVERYLAEVIDYVSERQ